MKRRGSRGLLLALLLATSCAPIGDMLKLVAAIRQEFGEPQVRVTVHSGGRLTITLGRGPLWSLEGAARSERARRMARFARDHYPEGVRLREIAIEFREQREIGPLTTTWSSVPYVFRRAELDSLPSAPPADSSGRSLRPART